MLDFSKVPGFFVSPCLFCTQFTPTADRTTGYVTLLNIISPIVAGFNIIFLPKRVGVVSLLFICLSILCISLDLKHEYFDSDIHSFQNEIC